MEEERKEEKAVEDENREFYTDEEFEEIYNQFWARMTHRFIQCFVGGFLTGLFTAGMIVSV